LAPLGRLSRLRLDEAEGLICLRFPVGKLPDRA